MQSRTLFLPVYRRMLIRVCFMVFIGIITFIPLMTVPQGHVSAATAYPHFKGLIQFRGQNWPRNASNPSIAGADITFYWSQLESQKGVYNWSAVDQAIQPWVTNHKKIILRISTAGWRNWLPTNTKSGTPQWVFHEGVPHVTEKDGAVYPQYWSPHYLYSLQTFVRHLAARYDRNPALIYVQIGIGDGGESKVDTHKNSHLVSLWQKIGYTDLIWWSTVQKIIGIYSSSFHTAHLAIMPNKTFITPRSSYNEGMLLIYAIKRGIWLQDDGLVTGRKLNPLWFKVARSMEQIASTKKTGDTLRSDIQAALNVGANYILIYTSDLNIPANRSTLRWAASLAHN